MTRARFDGEGFFAALDAQRLAKAMTWRQVAQASGVSASTLTRMSQGKLPDANGLVALGAWAGLDPAKFVQDTEVTGSRSPKADSSVWELRSGRGEDAEAVVALWHAADAEPTITDDAGSVARLVAHDPDALVVAEADSEIVGTLIVGFDGWRANLYRLAVHPRLRRRGLGLALVADAERRLARRGAPRANALVVADHAHAVGFWEAAGYGLDPRMGRHVKNLSASNIDCTC